MPKVNASPIRVAGSSGPTFATDFVYVWLGSPVLGERCQIYVRADDVAFDIHSVRTDDF